VANAGVKEEIGEKLPNGERSDYVRGNESKILQEPGAKDEIKYGNTDRDDKEPLDPGREPIGGNIPVHVGTGGERHRAEGGSSIENNRRNAAARMENGTVKRAGVRPTAGRDDAKY
jgi:hypothetical protein